MQGLITRSIAALASALLIMTGPAAFAAADDYRLDKLPPEQRELAEWFNAFLIRMDDKYFGRVAEMNGELVFDDREFSTEWSEHEVSVTRGTVMEKAGRLY